jgi:chromate transporter
MNQTTRQVDPEPADESTPMEQPPVRASLGELARYFTWLGFTAFGGPAAHVAMMQEELAERRRWVDKRYFLDMLGATQLVPGPNSTEMAIHIGYLHQGLRGLLVAGICFIWPAFLMVMAIALFYGAYGSLPQVQAIFYGIQPVIVAIVLLAVYKLGQQALKGPLLWLITVAAGLLTLFVPVNTVWIILGGGAIMLAAYLIRRSPQMAVILAPLPLLAPTSLTLMRLLQAATEPTLLGLFWFFLVVGATAMGSGYVIVSYFNDGLVERLGWLTASQVVDAIAVGQMTPGPVFTSAGFAGYLAMAGNANNVPAGIAGAIVSVVAIFLPAFVIVWLMAPWVPRLRRSAGAATFLDGVNAAVVGSIAATTWTLLRAAAFNLPTPVVAIDVGRFSIDLLAMALFLLALALMVIRPRLNSTWLIGAGAVVGLVALQFV